MVAFPFFKEPRFVEGDFLTCRVLGFGEAGQKDAVFAEFAVHFIHCVTNLSYASCVLKNLLRYGFTFSQISKRHTHLSGLLKVSVWPKSLKMLHDCDRILSWGYSCVG